MSPGPAASSAGPKLSEPVGAKFAPIESLRGWAALGVLVHHVAYFPPPHFIGPGWANTLAEGGGQGVSLFFVISAFTLMHSAHSRRGEPFSLRSFYLRRFFRIAPLFYAWLAIRLIADFSHGIAHSSGEIALNASFLFNFFPHYETGIVWTSWTIGLEMAFYVAFPLFAKFATSISRSLALFALSLAVWMLFKISLTHLGPVGATDSLFYKFSLFRHLPSFAAGIACYHVYSRYVQDLKSPLRWGAGLLVAAAGLCGSSLFLSRGWNEDLILLIQIFACAGLLLGLLLRPLSFLVNRTLGFCGQCSYSIYLNHAAFVFALIPWYQRYYEAGGYRFYKFVACCAITGVLVVIVSWLTYRIIEVPGMELGRRILAHFRPPQSVPVVVLPQEKR